MTKNNSNVGIFLIILGLVVVLATFFINWSGDSSQIFGSQEPTYDLHVWGKVQYNPIDILGQRWYVSGLGYTFSEHRGLFTFAIWDDLVSGFVSTDTISVKATLADENKKVWGSSSKTLGKFSEFTGGTFDAEFDFKNLRAGKYDVIWEIYEGTTLRQTVGQQIEIRGG